MLFTPDFVPTRQPQCKIELHVHLETSVRLTTIWELMQKKGHHLPVRTLEDLRQICSVSKPSTLADFLRPIGIFLPFIVGDGAAIERIAYEFTEDAAYQGVLYCEPRCNTHLFASVPGGEEEGAGSDRDPPLGPRDVLDCILRGFRRGESDFGIKVRSVLCWNRGSPKRWAEEMLELAVECRDRGVVGIDIAGDESEGVASPEDVHVFQRAAALGIHRTAHAGVEGPASNVSMALNELHVERVGHGYHAVDDPVVYQQCLKAEVHFEACPYSSLLCGSVPLNGAKHPIVRFAEDNANFSISRDDPTLTQKTLDDDYDLVRRLGLKDVHIVRANFNAARSCFLPAEEKKELLSKLMEIYGAYNGDPKTVEPRMSTV